MTYFKFTKCCIINQNGKAIQRAYIKAFVDLVLLMITLLYIFTSYTETFVYMRMQVFRQGDKI